MNHSIYGADRATHLKIVVMALLAAITITSFGLTFHLYAKTEPSEASAVYKAGKPVQIGSAKLALSH